MFNKAKGAYDQYQQSNSGHGQQDNYQQQQQNDGYQGSGPAASQYHASQQQQQHNYGEQQQQHSSGGFDISQAAGLVSGFLGKDNKQQHGQSGGGSHSQGGIDFSQVASMVSGFMGSGGSHGQQGDMVSSALKLATSGGFNQGHQASHDDMKSSYHNVFGSSGSDGMASKGQSAMGLAAAYMAFKKFQGGGSQGGSQNQLVSMAMSEAKKLFGQHEQQGGSANEKETLATAAQAAMKLFASR
ncbi:hypothetical protein IWW55_000270 [Coemansia sp. RSA 2706]|nr:hypothetical protein IWW55_000270 [Coemansia sp. RSA 2706]